jgi:hypothetical protein
MLSGDHSLTNTYQLPQLSPGPGNGVIRPIQFPPSSHPHIAARSIHKTTFDHKIHLQNQFFKKLQPRFHFCA